MLVVVALELGRTAIEPLETRQMVGFAVGIAVIGLVVNVGLAVVLGTVGYWLLDR